MQLRLPPSFLWGAALSSYQVEGQNFNSDWYLWERQKDLKQAGSACNHYHLFANDFKLAQQLNLNSLRISVEWARISPDASSFSEKELEHYLNVIQSLKDHNLKPIITLHHFTNPIWFSEKGGWLDHKNIDYFLKYLRKTIQYLKDKVEYWLIFNEPLVYLYNGFIEGIWPPGEQSLKSAKKALDNILKAYLLGYQEIKSIYQGTSITPRVSLAKNMRVFSPYPDYKLALNSLTAGIRSRLFNYFILEYLHKKRALDFIGLNYYGKEYDKFSGFLGKEGQYLASEERKNSLGWTINSRDFYKALVSLKKFNLPVLITENGTAEDDPVLYQDYLLSHLRSLGLAIKEGLDVRGYLWWSLIDNFEWDKGFSKRFGLFEVDYSNFQREPREFSAVYSKIAGENQIEI